MYLTGNRELREEYRNRLNLKPPRFPPYRGVKWEVLLYILPFCIVVAISLLTMVSVIPWVWELLSLAVVAMFMLGIYIGNGFLAWNMFSIHELDIIPELRGWRERAAARIKKAAGMLGMSPIDTARKIYSLYITVIREDWGDDVFRMAIETLESGEDYIPFLHIGFDGLPGLDGLPGETGERERIARVVEEVWLREPGFAGFSPVRRCGVFVPVGLLFSLVIFLFPVSDAGSVLGILFIWGVLFAWVIPYVFVVRRWVRFRGRGEWRWLWVPAVIVIAGISGVFEVAGCGITGDETVIELVMGSGAVPWLVGRFAGGIAFGMSVGLPIVGVRSVWKRVIVGGIVWLLMSVAGLGVAIWSSCATGLFATGYVMLLMFNIPSIYAVALILRGGGLRETMSMVVAGMMYFSDYIGILAALMGVVWC